MIWYLERSQGEALP
jgi:hypothetical protein